MRKNSKSFGFCLLVLFVLISVNVFGQGEANVWIGPTRVGLNFNAGSPTTFVAGAANGVINATNREGEGCSSIADAAGNLLFYTEGVNVYNRNNATMPNGTGLLGNISSTQSAVIVPCPANPTRFYYIFCAPPEEASAAPGGSSTSSDGITYSIVDMTGDGGLGSVTTKNVRVTPAGENATEGLTAVPNFDGTGFWIIAHRAGDKTSSATSYNRFYIYGITTAGINATTGVITTWNNQSANVGTGITGVPASNSGNGQVIIKSNSCFNKLAMTFFAKNSLVELYNFNNSTGAISLANSITNVINNQVYGVEFSPNGQYLYVTILETSRRLYQFNISSGVNATINAARTEWTPTSTSLRWGQLQLGPDGKIYMAHHVNWDVLGSGAPHASIGVINNPNVGGTGATFVEQQITTTNTATYAGTGTKHGLPQFYKGFIAGVARVQPGAGLSGLDEVCVGEPAQFEATYTQSGTNWRWNIDANVGPNTVDEYFTQNITHTYTAEGIYDVVLQLQDATCLYNVTERTQIRVNPVVNSAGTISCGAGTLIGNVTSPNAAYRYVWYSDAAMTRPVAMGSSSVSLPYLATDNGTFYLRAEANTTTSTTSGTISYFPTNIITGYSSPASGNTMTFTVNSAINLSSFTWGLGTSVWSGCPANRAFTVRLTDNAGTGVFYTANRTMNACAGSSVVENVNIKLGPGTYRINITGPAGLRPENNSTGYTFPYSLNAAVTFGAGNPNFLQDFNFTVPNITPVSFPCSKPATITYNCPLPVTWLDFTANRTNEAAVLLNWSTATEQDSKLFYVQRSADGINFETVGEVAAAGNSNSIRKYEYLDASAPLGNVYYRLLQVDFDGASMFSKIVYVNGVGTLDITLVPNPGNGSFTIVGLSGDAPLNVSVYTITGQFVYNTQSYPGEVISLDGVAKGFYIVKVLSGNVEQSIRYINQ